MADFVDATVRDIDNRLSELQEEVTRLEAARSALLGSEARPGAPARIQRRVVVRRPESRWQAQAGPATRASRR